MMEVGKKYKNLTTNNTVKCVYISDKGGAAAIENSDGNVGVTHKNSKWWVEVPNEKWVVLMWTDLRKNSVIVNSEIFPSFKEGFEKWDGHWAFIKVVQIE